jgi:hypothetical protein
MTCRTSASSATTPGFAGFMARVAAMCGLRSIPKPPAGPALSGAGMSGHATTTTRNLKPCGERDTQSLRSLLSPRAHRLHNRRRDRAETYLAMHDQLAQELAQGRGACSDA